jgi:ABC-2 type transport system ATP-binding protein
MPVGRWNPVLGFVDVDIYTALMVEPILQTKGLSRSFGEFQAVKPVDLEIYTGEIVVLTGPNGAGKTTLLNCLSGILRPTRGNILVEGFDLYREEVAAKRRLAFVPDVPRFYTELTTWEHLRFISLAFGIEQDWEGRAEAILREFNMWENRDIYPHNLSRGMRLKLGISLALIRPFKVLLMDEPTSALDPESADLLHEKLLMIRNNGGTILLTSHDLSMVEELKAKRWRMELGQLENN